MTLPVERVQGKLALDDVVLEYDLKGKYRKFSCVLGVDPRVGAESQPKVTIEIDGRTKFSKVITAKMIEQVNLDVTKANSLPTNSATAFQSAARTLLSNVGGSFDQIGAGLSNAELEKAAAKQAACKSLNG